MTDFFSHTAPGESSFAAHYRDDGVDCSSLGENILYRTRSAESPEAVATNVVDQWMGSAGHRENILGDWQSEGIGVAVTDDGVLYATQGFGSCPGTSDAGGGSSGGDDGGSSDSGSSDSGSDGSGGSGDASGGGSGGGNESADDGDWDGRWHHRRDDDPSGDWWTPDGSANFGEEKAVGDWCADLTAGSD